MNTTEREHIAGNGHDGDSPDATPGESFSAAMKHLAEVQAYARQFVSAKLAGIKLSIRNVVIYAILGVVALLTGGAMVVTAASLIVVGLSQWIGHLLGDRAWAGNLIVGALILGLTVGVAMFAVRKIFNVSREATVKGYERRLKQQRVTLDGHDARQRSAEYVREHYAD